ncbi:MAG: hypothetical protein K9M57_03335, partial [Phycisphaerae bacterium]|nr:hypothetical protein [Phycisphaerae bacterium]
EYLAKMAGAKPKDKAQWLDKALTVIPNNILLAHYKEELNAIKSMETDGSTSFKDKYELLETIFGLETRLGERKIDTEAIVKDIDAALAKYKTTKEQTQSLYLLKFQTLQRTQPPTGTEALLDQAYAAAPDSDQAEKIKGMKSYYFPKLVLPATLKSSIIPYSGQQEIKAFDGDKDSFFVGSKPPQKDDTFELALTKAQAFKTATVFTGHSNHPKLILDKGVLEISYDGQTFTQAAQFEEGKATATLNGAPLKAVRIKVTEGQKQMLIISEIVLE